MVDLSKEIPLEKILVINSTYQSNKLRKRLLKSGLLSHVCVKCNNSTWLDKPIPLELNHKNGDNSDNRLFNLELICPNCHAFTDSYRGKNWGKAKNKHYYAGMAERVDATVLRTVVH